MQNLQIVLEITIGYIVVTTIIGMLSARYIKDTTGFMTAKNMLGPAIVGFLLGSEFIGTGAFLGTAETAYSKGMWTAMSFISLSIGFVLYAFFMAPKYNQAGEYTISGILQKKYGKATRWMVSIVMIYALLAVSVTNYTGGAVTIASVLNVDVKTASLILGTVIAAVLASGGLHGIGVTNIIHIVTKMMAITVIAVAGYVGLKGNPAALASIPAQYYSIQGTGVLQIITWTVGNIGAVFSTQYVVQSIASLNNRKESFRASIIASVVLFPIGILGAWAGVAARGLFPNIKAVMAVPSIMSTMSPAWVGIVTAGIMAGGMVALSACLLGATALVVKDFYVPLVKPSEKHAIIATRIIAVIITFLPLPFAWYVPGLLSTMFFSRGLRASIGVLAVFMFYLPRIGSGRGVVWGLVCTIILTTVWYSLHDPFGIDNLYIAMGAPAVAMFIDHFIICLIKKKKNVEVPCK